MSDESAPFSAADWLDQPLQKRAALVTPSMPPGEDGEGERIAALQARLLAWYRANRRDLPWRRTRDPYAILVAETMLQQTQVPRVLPRYLAWLERFPTLAALAAAPTAEVLREWSGLGYNGRAVRLQQVARLLVTQNDGQMPETVEALLALPGIGEYTARAVACFAYEQDVPVLDTNVKRVLHRVLAGPEVPRPLLTDRQLWALAARAVPVGQGYDWNQGLMDFGSLICTARRPACLVCPLRADCRAAPTIHAALAARQGASRRQGQAATSAAIPFTSTNRHYRGQTLRVLGAHRDAAGLTLDLLGPQVKPGYTVADRPWLYALVSQLDRDGLVTLRWSPPPLPAPAAIRESAASYSVDSAADVANATSPDGAGLPGEPSGTLDLRAVRVSLPEA